MFQIKYDRLFSMKILHSFYASGISRDFSILPSDITANMMQEYCLKSTDQGGMLNVLCRKNADGTPDTPIDQPVTLTFFLFLNNSLFGNFSELENTKRFYFSNLDGSGNEQNKLTTTEKLTPKDTLPEILPQHFNWSIEKGIYKRIRFYQVIPGAGLEEIEALNIEIEPAYETVEIKIPQPGFYTIIMEKIDGSAPVESDYYVSDEASLRNGYFGIIEFFFNQSIHDQPKEYILSIAHKTLKWRYFLTDNKELLPVDKNNDDVPDEVDGELELELSKGAEPLSVGITYETAPGLPTTVSFVPLGTLPEADQKLVTFLKSQPSVVNVYVFESDIAIPILERARPKIRLQKKESIIDTDFILPIPTAETFNATIFINI